MDFATMTDAEILAAAGLRRTALTDKIGYKAYEDGHYAGMAEVNSMFYNMLCDFKPECLLFEKHVGIIE